MKIEKIIHVLQIVVLILILSSIYLYFGYKTEVSEINIYLKVGKYIGFNVNNSALYFGTIPPSGEGYRELIIENKDNRNARVIITAISNSDLKNWISVSDNNFILKGNDKKEIKIYVKVPENASFGNYSGKLRVYLKKKH